MKPNPYFAQIRKYSRFIAGLHKFHEARLGPDEAIALARTFIKQRVAAREENFVNLVEKGIFQNPASPYLKLLQPKKIEFEDVKSWVSQEGLERSLCLLESEGVYFTVDEFKGRNPVKRNGVEFQCEPSMFDNPFLSYVYEVQSGATRSAGTRVRIDFDYLHQRSFYDAFCSISMAASPRRWRTGFRCFRARRESIPACVSRTSATPRAGGSLRLTKRNWTSHGSASLASR